ncbi:hypothetical protein D3C87_1278020 [compost metagenome]
MKPPMLARRSTWPLSPKSSHILPVSALRAIRRVSAVGRKIRRGQTLATGALALPVGLCSVAYTASS